MKVKEGSHPYQAPPRRAAYSLQWPFKEELDTLRKLQELIVPLDVDEMSEECNSFVLASKANSKVQLCLDPARLNKVLIRPVHRGQPSMTFCPGWQGLNTPHLLMQTRVITTWNWLSSCPIEPPFFMSIWQVQAHKTTIQNITYLGHVSKGDRWGVSWATKCIWHCWWYFNCRL